MAIVFYQKDATVYAVHYKESENPLDVSKLEWLFSGATGKLFRGTSSGNDYPVEY